MKKIIHSSKLMELPNLPYKEALRFFIFFFIASFYLSKLTFSSYSFLISFSTKSRAFSANINLCITCHHEKAKSKTISNFIFIIIHDKFV